MPSRVLIVAPWPSTRARPGALPLRGYVGDRLEEIVGRRIDKVLAPFDVEYLLPDYRGRSSEDGAYSWPVAEGRERAQAIAAASRELQRPGLVLLGQKVAEAFGIAAPEWYRWLDRDGLQIATTPHPSRGSRVWNDPAQRTVARRWWRALCDREAKVQGQGKPTRGPDKKPRRKPSSVRSKGEMTWLLDLAEDSFVQTMSVSLTVRAMVDLHSQMMNQGGTVVVDGQDVPLARPLTRAEAAAILRDVRERFAERHYERLEEKREKHLQGIAARIRAAAKDKAWSAVATLLRLAAEVDGVVGRPDERAASLQVSILNAQSATTALDQLSDDELMERARRTLGLPGRIVDAASS